MAENKPKARPTAPHLGIYRPPVTMLTSITHRATGIALGAGTLLLACWLVALALGPEAYEKVQAFHNGFIGRVLLLGFSWSLIYHLLNGIRHLFWDAGKGFEKETADMTGKLVIAGSVLVTLAVWFLAYMAKG